jgi:hypothetical protein
MTVSEDKLREILAGCEGRNGYATFEASDIKAIVTLALEALSRRRGATHPDLTERETEVERLTQQRDAQLIERAIEKTKREAAEAEVERLREAVIGVMNDHAAKQPLNSLEAAAVVAAREAVRAALSNSGGT